MKMKQHFDTLAFLQDLIKKKAKENPEMYSSRLVSFQEIPIEIFALFVEVECNENQRSKDSNSPAT